MDIRQHVRLADSLHFDEMSKVRSVLVHKQVHVEHRSAFCARAKKQGKCICALFVADASLRQSCRAAWEVPAAFFYGGDSSSERHVQDGSDL